MKSTSKGRYALTAILDLIRNSDGKPVRLREISDRQGISLHYLEQIFRNLRQGGVVRSVRGPGGGYIMATGPEQVSVKDVFTSVGETVEYSSAIPNGDDRTDEYNRMRSFMGDTLEAIVLQQLEATTLSDLLE